MTINIVAFTDENIDRCYKKNITEIVSYYYFRFIKEVNLYLSAIEPNHKSQKRIGKFIISFVMLEENYLKIQILKLHKKYLYLIKI